MRETIDLGAVRKATSPTQLLRVFRKHKDFLTADGQEAARGFSSWEHTSDGTALALNALTDTEHKLHVALTLRRVRGPELHMFKASCAGDHRFFDFPLHTTKNLWVCAAFDRDSYVFASAMVVGSFSAVLTMFVDGSLADLQTSYAEYVNSLDSVQLAKLRTSLQNTMLEEVEAADEWHRAHVASIRGRYRNQLNYFTALLDDAQSVKDKREKAAYTFECSGYPPSKPYSAYKDARRAHSKRNVPLVECVIIRHVGKQTQTFARWSVDDRVWAIL